MRLLTHNVMRNNASAASRQRSTGEDPPPLRITAAVEVRVDEPASPDDPDARRREVEFARHTLPVLDWRGLVDGARSLGLESLPPEVTPELAGEDGFLRALYHVLMNVHLVNGMLTCAETGREFPVSDGVVDFMLEESECE